MADGDRTPADVEALRRSLAERETALAHAVRELADARRKASEDRDQAERRTATLEIRAQRLEEELGKLRREAADLRKGTDAEVRKRSTLLEDRLRAAQARAAETSSAYEERARAAELAVAEWHRLMDELAEARTRLSLLTRPPPPVPVLTPGTVTRLTEAARKLRCPRCASAMTEYQHALVRADKCDECFGIFFDNGELELVIAKTLEDRDAQWELWGDLFKRE